MTTFIKEFGRSVKQLRETHAWSQEQLAELAGLSRAYVSEVERGTVIASLATLDKLACAFGLSAAALLTSRDAVPQKPPGSRDAAGREDRDRAPELRRASSTAEITHEKIVVHST